MENHEIETSSDAVAAQYIETALKQGQESLKKTRNVAAGVTVAIVGYLGFVTATFHSNLEPEGAATVATGLAVQRFDELEPTLSSFVHEQVPQAIRQVPDEVIARMPDMREQLEQRVEDDLRAHSEESGKRLSAMIGRFVEEHKDGISTFVKEAQDPAAADALGDALEKEFIAFLHEESIGGTTIAEKLDHTLDALEQVDARTAKLASNKGLTSGERKARHAVALLMHRIDGTPDDGTVSTTRETINGIATAFHR
ncbi:hypothetical protein EON82_01380 [bacterium]|nr:MAG: hypothetical protein EON82_01380 [bacterium]